MTTSTLIIAAMVGIGDKCLREGWEEEDEALGREFGESEMVSLL